MLREIASAVREKRVSPVELVEEALRRIDTADAELNAVVALRAEQALEEARNHPCAGPLAGVPFLVKDLEDVTGMRTTYGSLLHAGDTPATEDDAVCAKLRAAGAIPVGKTNTPEFAYVSFTSNRVFGVTRNPWNPEMSPGGSSGGASAALAAAMVPLVTSSDGGGSVRIPASQTGLIGYKPTFGSYGRSRVPGWMTFSMNGTLSGRVEDLLVEAAVLRGPQSGDLYSLVAPPPLVPRRPARIVACTAPKGVVDPVVAANFETALVHLADTCGLPVERIDQIWDDDIGMLWLTVAAAEIAQVVQWGIDAGRQEELDPGFDLMRTFGTYVTMPAYLAAQKARFAAARRLDEVIGDEDTVLVTPTTNVACWPAAGPMPTTIAGTDVSPVTNVNTMEYNFTTHPAVAIPFGAGPSGVPLSLQAAAMRGHDAVALGLAELLQESSPWQTTAAGFDPFPSDF